MFTGLIEDVGTITERSTEDGVVCLDIAARTVFQDISLGASVAVNGVCLTVVNITDVEHNLGDVTDNADTVNALDTERNSGDASHGDNPTIARFQVMAKTLERTTLKDAGPGTRVNLERPLIYNTSRLDGHFTLGHVDGTTTLLRRTHDVNSDVFRFALPHSLAAYVVDKGSIAINGTSLTVSALGRCDSQEKHSEEEYFEVALIPTTLTHTVLGDLQPGDEVNVEVDILGKYIARMLKTGYIQPPSRGIVTE